MSLTEELNTIRQQKDVLPPDAYNTIQADLQDLSRSGIDKRSLKIGNTAPDFMLPDISGQPIRLYDLLQKGPVVVSFYRGSWCVFCSTEFHSYQSVLSTIQNLGATLLAISPQTLDCTPEDCEPDSVAFHNLSDKGNAVARKFGIVYHLADEMQSVYQDLGLDLPEYNGDDSFDLPVPATYVIDTDATIRLAFVNPDYTRRLDPVEVLAILKTLKSAA